MIFPLISIALFFFSCLKPSDKSVRGYGPSTASSSIAWTDFYGQSYAAIIGINNYQHLPDLKYAVNDAKSVQNALEQRGFQMFTLFDEEATAANIRKLLYKTIPEKLKPNDRVLIFFAGHGESLHANGYLLPVEAGPGDAAFAGIKMSDMQENFNNSSMYPAKHVLYIADACYSGLALTRSVPTSPATERYVQHIMKHKVRVALTAGADNEEVVEKNGHGIFTQQLLNGLSGQADQDQDGIITTAELWPFLSKEVSFHARQKQTPQYGRSGTGEFIFRNLNLSIKSGLRSDDRLPTSFNLLDLCERSDSLDSIRRLQSHYGSRWEQLCPLVERSSPQRLEGPGFECANSDDPISSLICSNKTLSGLNGLMTIALDELIAKLPPLKRQRLIKVQKEWRQRDIHSACMSLKGDKRADCIEDGVATRILMLVKDLSTRPSLGPIQTGRYPSMSLFNRDGENLLLDLDISARPGVLELLKEPSVSHEIQNSLQDLFSSLQQDHLLDQALMGSLTDSIELRINKVIRPDRLESLRIADLTAKPVNINGLELPLVEKPNGVGISHTPHNLLLDSGNDEELVEKQVVSENKMVNVDVNNEMSNSNLQISVAVEMDGNAPVTLGKEDIQTELSDALTEYAKQQKGRGKDWNNLSEGLTQQLQRQFPDAKINRISIENYRYFDKPRGQGDIGEVYLLLGRYAHREKAIERQGELRLLFNQYGIGTPIEEADSNGGKLYMLKMGPFKTESKAITIQRELRRKLDDETCCRLLK